MLEECSEFVAKMTACVLRLTPLYMPCLTLFNMARLDISVGKSDKNVLTSSPASALSDDIRKTGSISQKARFTLPVGVGMNLMATLIMMRSLLMTLMLQMVMMAWIVNPNAPPIIG